MKNKMIKLILNQFKKIKMNNNKINKMTKINKGLL